MSWPKNGPKMILDEGVRVLVCGGRDYADAATVGKVLSSLAWYRGRVPADTIVHGAARGADSLADKWAKQNDVRVESYPADWDSHGKAAGPIRNQRMLDTGVDLVIAFPGGRGTHDMMSRASANGVPVLMVRP